MKSLPAAEATFTFPSVKVVCATPEIGASRRDEVRGNEPVGKVELVDDSPVDVGNHINVAPPCLPLVVVHADVNNLAWLPSSSQ